MNTAEIISLIASISAMISAFAAVITCFLHYRFTKPKIEVTVDQGFGNCVYIFSENSDGKPIRTAYMRLSI
ncbi:MAG: hypothetical protein NC311_18820, partial [Muribaculaceae bacterium]|nr:hypothetical protein [Muribaculaceae bacterium]